MGTLIEFKNEILDSYLSGFFNMLNDILQKGEDLERIKQESAKESSKNSKRDNLIPIYMYCKNLWDKWLIAGDNTNALPYVNRFTVKEYFKNFLFIDSFYRNVYNLLAVNCQHFINLVEGINKNGGVDSTNLYSFLGNLASKTRCLFVAIPDYINLGTVDNEGKMLDTGIRNMEKIFKPIPLKDMRPIQTDNKFVIIYTHEPSKNKDNKDGFLKDSFDICDRDGKLTNEAEHLFGGIKLPFEETKRPVGFMGNMDTKAFPVPSFAVAFGGINNHLFQSIDVNMDNPIATEHSINITSQIAQMGSGNSQSIAYQGQDVYPIFSNYAYESKVEMMGNAQIQPLMYYQLMNIPMWKGAYMIFNVQHSITPGNMVTTFRGMKMSKNCVPYLEKWAYPVESPEGMPKLQLVGNDNVSVNNDLGSIDLSEFAPAPYPFKNIPESELLTNVHNGAIIKTYDPRNRKFEPLVTYSQIRNENLRNDTTSPLTTLTIDIPSGDIISFNAKTSGYKYNNPCSIGHSSTDIGYIESTKVADGQKFAKYKDIESGIASAMRLIKRKYGLKSPLSINTLGYQGVYSEDEKMGLTALRVIDISNMSKGLGIKPTQRINTDDKHSMMALIRYIAKKECGTVLGKDVLERAYNLAF